MTTLGTAKLLEIATRAVTLHAFEAEVKRHVEQVEHTAIRSFDRLAGDDGWCERCSGRDRVAAWRDAISRRGRGRDVGLRQ